MLRAPFPYFGSKRHAAALVWRALGDVTSYCEPFCGSAAVLLARPGGAGRIETINDLSGHVANFWRAVRQAPAEVARHLDYPVIETDLHARHCWLVARHPEIREQLDVDPDWCDPKAAGWWAWGASAWLGDGWCNGRPSKKLPNMSAGMRKPSIDGLCERFRSVRVLCGDFRRALTPAAVCASLVGESVGVFLDPPYTNTADTYSADGTADVPVSAAAWAAKAAEEHPRWRIVLAGYDGEHELAGWRKVAWNPGEHRWGGGPKNAGTPHLERLWLSPACLPVEGERGHQRALFSDEQRSAP